MGAAALSMLGRADAARPGQVVGRVVVRGAAMASFAQLAAACDERDQGDTP